MRKLFSALLLTLVTTNASALSTATKDLLATIAMPLAVAAVSRVTGVQQTQLTNLVSSLNQANVPPAQFVDVMRYTPVALTGANGQPFVTYVQTQASQGVTGDALVNAIVQQLQSRYNVTRQAPTYVVADNYIPGTHTEVTPFDSGYFDNSTVSGSTFDVIALPLAVAAVSDINGVPQDQLASLIAALNQANMPPNQMIEVVRYVPVALVDDPQPFVQYVQQQTSRGVTGAALYPLVARRLQPYYPTTRITLAAPAPAPIPPPVVVNRTPIRAREVRRPVVVDQNFFPPVVVNRTAEVRQHPHGGPPGQLKKQYGLQTGAQVVHGNGERKHGDGRDGQRQVVVAQPAPVAVPQVIAPPAAAPIAAAARGNGRGPEGKGPPGQNKDGQNGQNKDKEHGKDKGKGKD